MTAREDLLRAAQSLTSKGRAPFSPAALIAEARALGSTYSDSTLNAHVTSHMTGDGKELVRVDRGSYALSDTPPATRPPAPPTNSAAPPPADSHAEWFWEGNVQALVVRALAADGWHIMRVAGTATKEQGVDVEAAKDGRRLLVEVKGYPSSTYARGEKAGQPRAHAATHARHYFSGALLAGMLMRAEHPDALVVLAFPAFGTYRNLAQRIAGQLAAVGISCWLVDEHGSLTTP